MKIIKRKNKFRKAIKKTIVNGGQTYEVQAEVQQTFSATMKVRATSEKEALDIAHTHALEDLRSKLPKKLDWNVVEPKVIDAKAVPQLPEHKDCSLRGDPAHEETKPKGLLESLGDIWNGIVSGS